MDESTARFGRDSLLDAVHLPSGITLGSSMVISGRGELKLVGPVMGVAGEWPDADPQRRATALAKKAPRSVSAEHGRSPAERGLSGSLSLWG